jgi:hypothetical protein
MVSTNGRMGNLMVLKAGNGGKEVVLSSIGGLEDKNR